MNVGQLREHVRGLAEKHAARVRDWIEKRNDPDPHLYSLHETAFTDAVKGVVGMVSFILPNDVARKLANEPTDPASLIRTYPYLVTTMHMNAGGVRQMGSVLPSLNRY